MKKILLLFILISSITSQACEVCGGGAGNYNPFLYPYLSKNFAGVHYMSRTYHTHSAEGQSTHSSYNTYMASAQFSISPKWQVITLLPWQQLRWSNGKESVSKSGMGDISFLATYKLFDRQALIRQTVFLSAGLKLCTGDYSGNQQQIDPSFQLGTGSTDFLMNGSYRIAINKWIVNTVASYKINTTNSSDYRFGNILTLGSTVAYSKSFNLISLAPYLQIIREKQFRDRSSGKTIENTGGSDLYTGIGADLSIKKLTFGGCYQFVAKEVAHGEFNANPRLTFRTVLMF
jgi:hypothetical protein